MKLVNELGDPNYIFTSDFYRHKKILEDMQDEDLERVTLLRKIVNDFLDDLEFWVVHVKTVIILKKRFADEGKILKLSHILPGVKNVKDLIKKLNYNFSIIKENISYLISLLNDLNNSKFKTLILQIKIAASMITKK